LSHLRIISPRWDECIIAATGPSLTKEVADKCRGNNIIAVNDAYKLFPFADVLYACDAKWWGVHDGCLYFHGEKWSSHSPRTNEKTEASEKYGLNLIRGNDYDGFSLDPAQIHYGSNSGFQAINLAILFGCKRILLVGFDMHSKNGRHFFGDHPSPLTNKIHYENLIRIFQTAVNLMPKDIEIINCTPGSELKCFPTAKLEVALDYSRNAVRRT